ncbi:MAG: hypothetical protein ACRDWE_05970, partial [Acidimicrobiales bacterium]
HELEAILNPTRTGRPRQLKVDVFLAGVMLTAMKQGSLTLSTVHETLTKALPRSTQMQPFRFQQQPHCSSEAVTRIVPVVGPGEIF